MKKKHWILILVVILMLGLSTVAFAKSDTDNLKGTVVSVTPPAGSDTFGTLVLRFEDGEEITITLPGDFDYAAIQPDMVVVVKGQWQDGIFYAEWVQEADLDDDGDDGDDGDGEGNAWGPGGVYCAGGKDRPHPVAQKISDKYDVSIEWVMEQKCTGFGFGQVMLALQTSLSVQNGEEPEEEPEEEPGEPCEGSETCPENGLETQAKGLLDMRKEGKGWGQIWKETGLSKHGDADVSPSGWLKKPEKVKEPKEGKGPNKGPDHPSNKNKPEKVKNNKNK